MYTNVGYLVGESCVGILGVHGQHEESQGCTKGVDETHAGLFDTRGIGLGDRVQSGRSFDGAITAVAGLTGTVLLVEVGPMLAEYDGIEGCDYRFAVHALFGHGVKLFALHGAPHGPGG